MRHKLLGLSAAAAILALAGTAVAQQPAPTDSGPAPNDAPAPAAAPVATGGGEDNAKMPPLPSMEGQQGEVISRTAVSAPLRKKRPDESPASEKARPSAEHPKERGVATKQAKGRAKAKVTHKRGKASAKAARAHRAAKERSGHRKHR